MLRKNQTDAIHASVENDFESGVHFHCTGSGKSLIAFHILLEFHKKYPTKNVFWICEQKAILAQHFTKSEIEKSIYHKIKESTNYFLFDYSQIKNPDWYLSLNNAKFWCKPFLCVINRSFLVSFEKYKKIMNPVSLVIHDECHSALNKTTFDFYTYIVEKFDTKCIGFTATPCVTEKFPFQKIISSYSIYDAVVDNIIVPPKIEWIQLQQSEQESDNIMIHIFSIIKEKINELPFKKIIVWCGMIEHCFEVARKWKSEFTEFSFHLDVSKSQPLTDSEFQTFDSFAKSEGKSFLFCASKHREGSDIYHLDGAIFMDQVHSRNAKTFVQCIGRVLRKENGKSHGWILDTHSKGIFSIRANINKYLYANQKMVPWIHTVREYDNSETLHKIFLNTLLIQPSNSINSYVTADANKSNMNDQELNKDFTKQDIIQLFKRPIPNDPIYLDRLHYELDVILSKKLGKFLVRAMHILKIANDVIHVTRGSCGSSLICYLLNISHVDPIKYNIKFERFLTEYRNNMPDIDLDFPYNIRDNIFLKIEQSFPGKIARISNHVYFKEKSALRESLRKNGIRKFISKDNLRSEIRKMNQHTKKKIYQDKDQIFNTFRTYMLHCGGIIYYENGIPQDKILIGSSIQNQVSLNKHDVSNEKHFKIDILSSRSLSIYNHCWNEISGTGTNYISLIFPENVSNEINQKIFQMLNDGSNIGLILGESPLMRKAFMAVKCKNIFDIAKCLAIIRPASKGSFAHILNSVPSDEDCIFDDDVIDLISTKFGISLAKADNVRRIFAKSDREKIKAFFQSPEFMQLSKPERKHIASQLRNLSQYSFCKSHALSYAQLIYSLAYTKILYPQIFWKYVHIHAHTMYKKFVYESFCFKYGIDYRYSNHHNFNKSIYAVNKNKHKFKDFENLSVKEQFEKYSTWDFFKFGFYPNCFFTPVHQDNTTFIFRGIVAFKRLLKKKNVIFLICFDFEKFFELVCSKKFYKNIIMEGKCVFQPQQINYLLLE
jgi:superfamily II DNA or RNA helicase